MSKIIRVFFDGSCNDKYKTAAFIAKHNNETIHRFSSNINVPSSIYAEYKALEYGLSWANKNLTKQRYEVVVHGDCKPVILNVLKYKRLDRDSEFENLIEAHHSCRCAFDQLKKQHSVNLVWIPRSENSEVDDFSRPETERKGWRYGMIREINEMLIGYSRRMGLHNIQQTVTSFLNHYTGVPEYRHMSKEQLSYVRTKLEELQCAMEM